MRVLPLLGLCLIVAFSARAQEQSDLPQSKSGVSGNVTVLSDVVMGTGGGRPLHADIVYPAKLPEGPMPAVLWIHGGGWKAGTHKKNPIAWLADKGFVVASIEYRLSDEAKWPAQIEDCKLAVRWLRANAAKYHVNPDKIAVWGSSAGGHLVSCLGTMGDQTQFEGTGGYEGVSSKVQAVVDYCGPVDFTEAGPGIQRGMAKAPDYESPGLIGLFGGSFKEKTDLWKQGSPITYIKPGAPPFLVVHGDQDKSVPLQQAEKMVAALKKANVPVEFILVKGGGHGMHAEKGEPPAVPDRDTLNAQVLAFLERVLK